MARIYRNYKSSEKRVTRTPTFSDPDVEVELSVPLNSGVERRLASMRDNLRWRFETVWKTAVQRDSATVFVAEFVFVAYENGATSDDDITYDDGVGYIVYSRTPENVDKPNNLYAVEYDKKRSLGAEFGDTMPEFLKAWDYVAGIAEGFN